MAFKDFLNIKKPHLWITLATVLVLGLAGVVSVLDKEETVAPPAETVQEQEDVSEEVQVQVTKVPEKSTEQIIMERFKVMNREEVKKQAKRFGEEGWQNGIVILAELPEQGITLYGYNDAEYQYQGVAVDYQEKLNYFDWKYMSSRQILPEMFWNSADRQLQITLNLSEGTGVNAEELHVLTEYDEDTLEDYVFRSSDYLKTIEERLVGTGVSVGEYADIQLGKKMLLKFEPVQTVDGTKTTLKLHQAEIRMNPSKDGFYFELGDIGLEPEKRNADITLEGVKENYTEIKYVSDAGFFVWYPENILEPYQIYGHDGFVLPEQGLDSSVKVTIVPDEEKELGDAYLKEAAGNFKASKEYKKVTVGKIKKLQSDSEDVTIKMIEVVHDDTADRFYIVQGREKALLITVSLPAEVLEGMGARITAMIRSIGFEKTGE